LPRVLVIHRRLEIAAERASRLCGDGLEASAYPALGPSAFRLIRANPPDAILIDLTELPSYGRTMAALLREQKATRHIPLVFLKGDPDKAERVRELMPDAVFALWPNVAPAIRKAIRQAPAEPAPLNTPKTPLARKLRIQEGSEVALLYAPANVRDLLGPLPESVRLQKQIGDAPLVLVFLKSAAALERELPALASRMQKGRTLWICWPKRSSAEPCDLSMNLIREMALPFGLVDSKLCAMDATWSASAFTLRRATSRRPAARREIPLSDI
jgi:CheY-like chemotaxis protein